MINSNDEETGRVFTPINVDTALYSGNLVVGAKKTGSLVFEEPIDDENLKLNFYSNSQLEEKEKFEEEQLLAKEEKQKQGEEYQEEELKQKPTFTVIIQTIKKSIPKDANK